MSQHREFHGIRPSNGLVSLVEGTVVSSKDDRLLLQEQGCTSLHRPPPLPTYKERDTSSMECSIAFQDAVLVWFLRRLRGRLKDLRTTPKAMASERGRICATTDAKA